MSKTILSIGSKTRPENETIDIFGVAYKTLTVEGKNDIKIGARAKDFARRYRNLNLAAIDIEEITPDQAEELQTVVNDLTRIILPALPADVLEDLDDLEKLEILQAYFGSTNGKNLLAAAGVGGPVALPARASRSRQKAGQAQAS
jgi:hypothetical protein